MKEKVLKALRDALALMNNEGAHWLQGAMKSEYGEGDVRYCSLGAVYQVTGAHMSLIESDEEAVNQSGDVETRREAIAVLSAAIPDVVWAFMPKESHYDEVDELCLQQHRITSWNDSGGRTWPQIVQLFELAQKQVEGAPDVT